MHHIVLLNQCQDLCKTAKIPQMQPQDLHQAWAEGSLDSSHVSRTFLDCHSMHLSSAAARHARAGLADISFTWSHLVLPETAVVQATSLQDFWQAAASGIDTMTESGMESISVDHCWGFEKPKVCPAD